MTPDGDAKQLAAQVLVTGLWLIFVASVFGKLDGWKRWSGLASALPLPRWLVAVVRVLVPVLEATVAALLLLAPVLGLLAGSVLLSIFAIAVIELAKRIGPAECGCFGALTPTKLGTELAARDAVLAVVAAIGVALALVADPQRPPLPMLALGLLIGFWILLALEYERLSRAREARVGGNR